jgi:hypothetical protein
MAALISASRAGSWFMRRQRSQASKALWVKPARS